MDPCTTLKWTSSPCKKILSFLNPQETGSGEELLLSKIIYNQNFNYDHGNFQKISANQNANTEQKEVPGN